ncbi:MAG: hypothetical protein M1835_000201 [Candelina submexicana]|nr:MAG: hypothetical protein M1835_000201 [Candelina submexicana]
MQWSKYSSRYLAFIGCLLGTSSCAASNPAIHLSKRQHPDERFGRPTPSDCRDAWSLMPQEQGMHWYYGGSREDLPNDVDIRPLEVLPRQWAVGDCVIKVRLAFNIGGLIGPRFDETNWQTINEMADIVINIVVEAQGRGGFGFPLADVWLEKTVTRTARTLVEIYAKDSDHDKKGPASSTDGDDGLTLSEEQYTHLSTGDSWTDRVETWVEAAFRLSLDRQQRYGEEGHCRAVYCTHDKDCADSCGPGFKCGGGTVLSDIAAAFVIFGAKVISILGAEVCSNV